MSNMPSSLATQATQKRVTTEGIVSSSTSTSPTAGAFKIDAKPETVDLVRKSLLASAQAVRNKPKEVVTAITEMYGTNSVARVVDHNMLLSWTADYTEFKYSRELAKRLEASGHKVVIPLEAHTVGLESEDFDYIDESNGIPLKEQEWVTLSDAFIPRLMASVEIKTNTTSSVEASKKGKRFFNAKYGESYLKNSPGIIGYVHFVQVGSLSLDAKQKAFLRKRGNFSMRDGITLTSSDTNKLIENMGKDIYASYYIDSYSVNMLAVNKVNAIIANTLRGLGLVSGTPLSRVMSINIKGVQPRVVLNYIKQFAREGMSRSQRPVEQQKTVGSPKTEYELYEYIYRHASIELVRQAVQETPNMNYTDVINRVLEIMGSTFRFVTLNESFGIGRFEVEDTFILQSRV